MHMVSFVEGMCSVLGIKIRQKLHRDQTIEVELPDDLPDLPRELSFWIGAHLDQAASEQQTLLELTDTSERLERQFEMLDHTRRQLAARTVLMDLK